MSCIHTWAVEVLFLLLSCGTLCDDCPTFEFGKNICCTYISTAVRKPLFPFMISMLSPDPTQLCYPVDMYQSYCYATTAHC